MDIGSAILLIALVLCTPFGWIGMICFGMMFRAIFHKDW